MPDPRAATSTAPGKCLIPAAGSSGWFCPGRRRIGFGIDPVDKNKQKHSFYGMRRREDDSATREAIRPPERVSRLKMSTLLLFDFGSGLAMLAVAWIFGWSLFRFSRRHPESVFANDSVVADMVCVGEVFLIAFGIMFLARGLTVLV